MSFLSRIPLGLLHWYIQFLLKVYDIFLPYDISFFSFEHFPLYSLPSNSLMTVFVALFNRQSVST